MIKRCLSLLLAVCLAAGLLLPFSKVQAASDSVDYSMLDARNLNGGDISNIESAGTINWTKNQYDSGKLNWYILAHNNNRSGGETKITNSYGMRVGGNVDSWIAFVMEAPGTGTYTLQMTHSEYAYGADLAMAYIMPMSGSVNADVITNTVRRGAALGTVDFYSDTASGYNNKTTTLGSYSFTAGEEYVLILYASEGYQITGSTAYMIFSKFTAVKGTVSASADTQISPVDLGAMVTEFGMRGQIALREVNGYDYYFLPIKGGQMHIYNLDYYCDGKSATEPYITSVSTGITNAWGCSAGEDGKIYVTGDAKYVYRYDPDTGKGEKLTYSETYVCGYDVGADAAGNIYIALNKRNAGVAYYENATGKFHIYDGLDANGIADDCSAIAWDGKYIYAYLSGKVGSNSTQIIVQVDKVTGDVVKKKDVSGKVGSTGHLTGMDIVDGVLFAGSNNLENMIAIDIETWSYINVGVSGGIKGNVSQERNGKVYFICSDKYVYSYDIAKRRVSKLNISTSQSLHTSVNSFVTLDVDKDGADEDVIFSCRPVGNGYPLLYDITAQKMYSWTDMINTAAGAYVSVRDVYSSNDGSKTIFVGAYVSDNGAAYNINKGDYVNYGTAGQTDSQLMYKGVLYAGNYSSCTLAQIDVKTGTHKALTSLSGFNQKRIHCLAGGEDKIFFSTVPDSYGLGGYLAWYDLKTGATYSAKLSSLNAALADQVVLSMAYSGGYLYCGTTVRGGSDAASTKTTSHFFVFDVANKKVVAIQEVAYPYVASLDTDSSGTVWGVISKTLFTVSYKNGSIQFTRKFNKESETPLTDAQRKADAGTTDAWFGKTIYFGSDGCLYVVVGDTGLWKITKSGEGKLISSAITGRLYALGEDGNIYFGKGKNLMLLPLNVSASDKSAAQAVNTKLDTILKTQISNIGSGMTAVMDAYNKLTNVQKSLVNTAKINTANRRYVTALIDALPATVTLSHANKVEAALSAYEALPIEQQSRVSNLAKLEDADTQLRVLQGQSASQLAIDRVIDRINALPSVDALTLSDKSAVTAARKAYDSLSATQKNKITNYSRLTSAETRIKALEKSADQEAAMEVIRKINALPSNLTKNDQDKVDAARQAYDALTSTQQSYVTNYSTLVTAEVTMMNLVGGSQGAADVNGVIALIDGIPETVTLENQQAVTAARAAYNALSADKQEKVTNYQKLLDAEEKVAALGNPGGNVDGSQPGGTEDTQSGNTDGSQSGGTTDKNGNQKPQKKKLDWLTVLIVAGCVLVVAGIGVCVAVVILENKKEKAKKAQIAESEPVEAAIEDPEEIPEEC